MADCDFTVALDPASRNPQNEGDQFTIRIDPPLRPGCIFQVSINGQPVQPGDAAGDLKLVGLGAAGTATLEALRDNPTETIAITVKCEGPPPCGPTTRSVPVPVPVAVSPQPEETELPECGDDCFRIEYQFGDSEAQVFQPQTPTPGNLELMPTETSPLYGFAFYPGMREAFDAEVQREKRKYKPYSKGCGARCECEKDEGAVPRRSAQWTVPVQAVYTFPDQSGTVLVIGYFEVRQTKTPGTCRPKVPRARRFVMVPPSLRGFLGQFPDEGAV